MKLQIFVLLVWGVYSCFAENKNDTKYWQDYNQKSLLKLTNVGKENIVKKAKNVIMFLGDGMGLSTITSSRILKQQLNKDDSQLVFETFPNLALIQTFNLDYTVPDSAGTATAYLTGIKANKGVIGVNGHVAYGEKNCDLILNNQVESVFVKALKEGKKVGVVTTASITDATPAGSYAHVSNRNDESGLSFESDKCKDIARQLVEDLPESGFHVIMGGGRSNFKPSSSGGRRKDNLDLLGNWEESKKKSGLKAEEYKLVQTKQELDSIDYDKVNYLFGSFSDGNMKYDKQRSATDESEPSIVEMTKAAIKLLQKGSEGFFLLVEGAKIDKAHHINSGYNALYDTLAFDNSIAEALKLVDTNETLIIVTADHSHGFTLNGYAKSDVSIWGFSETQTGQDVQYTSLLYATGPGRRDFTNEDLKQTSDPNYKQHSLVYMESATHGGEDVAAYAIGPMSHLLRSNQDQTFLAHLMSFSACVGDYKTESHCKNSAHANAQLFSPIILLTLVTSFFYKIFY